MKTPACFCVNLARRPDRRLHAWAQFRREKLSVIRLIAPDANGIRNTKGWRNLGIRACALGHKLAWRRGHHAGADAILVFEDDVVLAPDFRERLESLQLPDDWAVCYLGCVFHQPPELISPGVLKITGATWDAHAYLIRRPFWEELAKEFTKVSRKRNRPPGPPASNDVIMSDMRDRFPAYSVWPPMAWQRHGLSNNENVVRGNYHSDGRQRFHPEAIAHLPWKGEPTKRPEAKVPTSNNEASEAREAVARKDQLYHTAKSLGHLLTLLQPNATPLAECRKSPFSQPTDRPRLLAVCSICQNRLSHLQETLPQTLSVLRQGSIGIAVVVDYACGQGTAEWVTKEFANDIRNGHLVVAKVAGPRDFQAGKAKAISHALGCQVADHLLNLDADNFFDASDMAELLRTAINHRVFVAQQFDGAPDTFGRIFLPTWLYRTVGGYHCDLKFYGGEDMALLTSVLKQPGAALVPVPLASAPPLQHSDEERLKGFAGHKDGMTMQAHIVRAAQEGGSRPHVTLEPTPVEVWDHRGKRQCVLDLFSLVPIVDAQEEKSEKLDCNTVQTLPANP